MQSIKIYPPAQLPDKNLSEQKFEAWQTELEVWLGEDDDMARFMGNSIYSEWTSAEVLSNRIAAISANDVEGAESWQTQETAQNVPQLSRKGSVRESL